MGYENLEHKEHNIQWEQKDFLTGRFLFGYCLDCHKNLGSLNITNILKEMEVGY